MAGGGDAAVPGALDDDQRLGGGGAAGEAGELAGVADGLQVHQRDVGVRVVVPVLHDVVAGDVGAVARRDEGGDAGRVGDAVGAAAVAVEGGEQGDADGAGLGEQADAAGHGEFGGEGGVEPGLGGGVDDAEGVGADDPHPVRAGLADQGALALAALGALFGVAGGDHHEALDAVLAALGDRLGHPFGGDGDDGEVDGLGDVAHRAVGADALDGVAGVGEALVDGVDRAGEPGLPDVPQDAAADPAEGAAHPDHGDRAGGQQPLDRAGLGALFAGVLHGERAVGGLQAELQTDDAVLEAALLLVARVGEDLDHLGVGGEHLGGEAPDAALTGDRRDVLQQGGGDTPALVRVLDEEGHLGLVGRGGGGHAPVVDPVVAHGGDELAADRHGQPHPVDVVVVGEAAHVLGREARVRGEEPVVLRLVRDLLVEAHQAVGVVGGDGPDARGAAVAEDHVGLPVGGIGVLVRRGVHGSSVRVAEPSGTGQAGPCSAGRMSLAGSSGAVCESGLDNIVRFVKGSFNMAERRVNVGWAEGLHARPASIFVRAATASGIPVTIAKPDTAPVNAASMLAVLGLGVQGGEEIVLSADADGAEATLERLAKLVAEGLDELPETV